MGMREDGPERYGIAGRLGREAHEARNRVGDLVEEPCAVDGRRPGLLVAEKLTLARVARLRDPALLDLGIEDRDAQAERAGLCLPPKLVVEGAEGSELLEAALKLRAPWRLRLGGGGRQRREAIGIGTHAALPVSRVRSRRSTAARIARRRAGGRR